MARRKTYTSTTVKNRWNAKNYDRVSVFVAKGSRDILKEIAESRGMSVNGYIRHLIVADNPEIRNISALLGGGGRLTPEEAIAAIIDGFSIAER